MHSHSLAGAICLLLIALSARATEPLRFGTFANSKDEVMQEFLRKADQESLLEQP